MSKRMKTFTKIISLILVVILFIEASPMSALAALVADVQGDNAVVESYDESRNFYYDSHSIDVGRAGTLSLNDYTLTPSLSFDALGIDGNVLPVSVSMKYNPSEYRFLKDVMGYTSTAYGNGWLTNYNRMLCELENENTTQIAYISGTGAVIVFEPDETDTSKWVLPETEDVYILKTADETYTIYTDSATRAFDSYGRLISVVNTVNSATNTIEYAYNDGTKLEYIAKIIDGVGNEYRFTYTDGLLTKIKCYNSDGNAIIAGDGENSAPLEMNFAYTSGNLTTVTFPDGKTVNYGYNSADVMFRAVNIDGYKAEITFADGFAAKLAEFSPNGTEGGYVNITRNENTRTFTDDKGKVQIKTFDDTGKILTIVDGDGNYLYGAPIQDEEDSTVTEEDSSDYIYEEDITETYESVCPCSDCTEWDCACACESEEVCNCVQCKRYSDTTEDEHGNVLSEESFDGTKTMKSQNFYTSDGNYLASSVDMSGNTVYYIYDEAGFMQSMTSGDMEVLFDYDAMGNLTRLYQQVNTIYGETTMANQYTYTNDKVTSITHNGFSYNFTYDEWGNQTSVKINDSLYVTYEYEDKEGERISEITYADGKTVSYTYNDDGNITGVSYDGGESNVYEYTYDSDGGLTQVVDNSSGFVTSYSDAGTEIRIIDGNTLLYSSVYNEDGTETENILGTALTYTYNSDYNQVTGKAISTKSFTNVAIVEEESTVYSVEQDIDISVTTDWFGRTNNKEITVDSLKTNTETEETSEFHVEAEYNYTYDDTDTTASTKVTSHSSSFISDSYTHSRTDYYEYDASGNITGIYRYVDGVKTYYYSYEYDEAGQLVRENILEDNKTILYIYDPGGNILAKGEFDYTLGEITEDMSPKSGCYYEYNNTEWKDQLTQFEYYDATSGGDDYIISDLTYDAAGNVASFNGQTYIWNANRQIESATNSEEQQLLRYSYNENGYLTRVDFYEDNGATFVGTMGYVWDGDKLISRCIVDCQTGENITARVIYDTDGEAIGSTIEQNTQENDTDEIFLLYRKNLQGDVTGLIDSVSGQLVASYSYDAYGYPSIHPVNDKPLSVLSSWLYISLIPQTYRGYIYTFVGGEICNYLGSRFYSPRLGRFLNADKHFDTGTGVLGTNMYAYCNNNPVMYTDPTGEALLMYKLINIITYLLNPLKRIKDALTTNAYEKRIKQECIELLRYHKVLHMNLHSNTYYSASITAFEYSFGKNANMFIDMKLTSKHVLGGNMKIIAEFECRTVKEWFAYINKSIVDSIPIYREIAEWTEENEVLMYALGECATGTFADALFVLDALDVFFGIYDEFFPSKKEKYVISELKRRGYTDEDDAYMIILIAAYSYQTRNKWWYTHPQKYNESWFLPCG